MALGCGRSVAILPCVGLFGWISWRGFGPPLIKGWSFCFGCCYFLLRIVSTAPHFASEYRTFSAFSSALLASHTCRSACKYACLAGFSSAQSTLSELKIDYLRRKKPDPKPIHRAHPKRPEVTNDPLARFGWFHGYDCTTGQAQCLAWEQYQQLFLR